MPTVWRLAITCWVLLVVAVAAIARDLTIGEWLAVPPESTGLALILDPPISRVRVFTFVAQGSSKIVYELKASGKLPLVHQFRLTPGEYQVRLSGTGTNLGLTLRGGVLNFLRLTPLTSTIVISTDAAASEVSSVIEEHEASHYSWIVDPLGSEINTLEINTEPPWPIPPPPPKR